jgi:hypothetical protein
MIAGTYVPGIATKETPLIALACVDIVDFDRGGNISLSPDRSRIA